MTSFSFVITPVTAVPAAKEGPLAWVHRDKIRMGWTPVQMEQYHRMKQAGMNAVMPRHELDVVLHYDPANAEKPLSKNDAEMIAAIREEAKLSKKLGLKYFHSLNLAAESQNYEMGFKDNPARFNDGRLPSPVDPVYWNRVIVDRVRRVLDLLEDKKTYALDAIIIDPEMYALADGLPGHADYGRFAFETYLKESKTVPPLAELTTAAEREAWIVAKKLKPAYERWQFNRVRDFGRQLERVVHSRRPELILGYIIYENKMWFHAMADGLSTKKMPAFVGPETTYSGVMDERMAAYLNQIRRELKVPVLLVPGVMMMQDKGQAPLELLKVLPGNIYQRCQMTEGYWVYAIYTFGNTEAEQKPFFDALKIVDDALDMQARTGRVASLKAQPLPIAKPAGFDALIGDARNWVPLPAGTAMAQRPFAPVKLRGSFPVMLWPKTREPATLSLSAIQLGVYLDQCEAVMLDANGQLLWRDIIPFNRTTVLRSPETPFGLVASLVGAGQNAFEVQDSNSDLVIVPDDYLTINAHFGFAGRYYFYVPPGKTDFKISLQGHAGETADYNLYDAGNEAVLNVKTLKATQTFDVKVTKPGVWCIESEYVVDDAGFKLLDLPNIFAIRPTGLRMKPSVP